MFQVPSVLKDKHTMELGIYILKPKALEQNVQELKKVYCLGGIFSLRIIFGQDYPDKPPRVKFTSEMFHPNGMHAIQQLPITAKKRWT